MDHRAGLERADDLLNLARELKDPALLLQAHHCQWATLYMLGAHEECCRHADEGIRLYDEQRHRLHAHLYGGHDPKVCALGERALSCWLLGRFDESLASIRLALQWADSLGDVGSRVHAMDYAIQVHRLRRDATEVAVRANAMAAFADEQHLGEHRARAMLFRGWARAMLGDVSRGLTEMRESLASVEAAGTPEEFPLFYEMFAEVCQRSGRLTEGLDAVEKGFVEAERGRLIYWNAELHRRRGEILLAVGSDFLAAAANCFEHALVDARIQGARFLELRAAACLARLRRGEGVPGRSLPGLPDVSAAPPGGPASPDFRDARGLLVEQP
jgi:predicted ATPase